MNDEQIRSEVAGRTCVGCRMGWPIDGADPHRCTADHALANWVIQLVKAARLDEAKWWEHLVGNIKPDHLV